ncbi:3-methylcrotonyl-CoA carboxylase alpha subunit/geranyl-CoA carboxylase alpha subunit [Acidovorax delafieldii]|uniref:3-methylcrotonyl-CoA carboxylase alpha subunit/geranyl-CoA carboxylase alpha subunit n=1 Tax=Acidovorax delafieldii TaxID=47920 RepID=A0A561XSC9_ACIDE|nr:biotin carboxylase N-terminal domain-containing protein [Acidovorax delafieldii]TWG39027.1 3-methylcrotonyl-CoA carboxylase alpha subunit/geranyl-CoA carboxylase alpha subunit [Acidovorax delafieldii]
MKKILIANRGEITRRVIHTAHRMGIETVAVYSDPDTNALHVREANQAVALGGAASADTYLRTDKLLAAARATGADAVHPGYGFLSENADFARAVVDAGLTWIGPPPAAIRTLGSKAGAKALAHAHGVPCLPGYSGDDQSDERFAAEAARIGTPLMVKAVAGGGGRGMRLVTDLAQLPAALASARSEALAGFGCSDLLIERALLQPRHVEVQIFADAHGGCIHLGERDCSVQRRHQKIIEESPSPAVDAALRERMGACAVALAQAAGYVGAGTVEFLLDGAEFFLMEMNTRLQVEHPVTEALTGLDLVEWQIRVARGEPLPLTQDEVHLQGHAIEVRLCAEDAHFRPHTGRVLQFSAPPATAFERAAPGALRFDHALEEGAEVTPHYDAMLGKLIVHAPTRAEAIAALVRALQGTRVLGLSTNRAFLAACLQHPVFASGHALVPFLAEHAQELQRLLLNNELLVHIPSALSAIFASNTPSDLPCAMARPLRLRHQGEVHSVAVRELGGGRLLVEQAGAEPVTLQLPQRGVHCVAVGPRRWHWQTGGVDGWVEDASWEPAARAGAAGGATELRAPFNGKVVALPVAAGQALAAGDTVVVIESMKLEHSLASPAAATVAELLVAPGQQVSPGQVLARFAPATQGAPA